MGDGRFADLLCRRTTILDTFGIITLSLVPDRSAHIVYRHDVGAGVQALP